MDKFKVIVTFQGQSKKIPLVVTPSSGLEKFRSEEAYRRFVRTARSVFSLPASSKFTFYEKGTGEELCSDSFTSEEFSKRWTLVVEGMDEMVNGSGDNSPSSAVKVAPTVPGDANGLDQAGQLLNGYDKGTVELEEELEEVEVEGGSDVFVSCGGVDSGREVHLALQGGGFGCVFRYFIIQEDYSGDEGRSGSGISTGGSGDILTTLFVYNIQPGGPADQAGMRKGDKVFSINGERITSSDFSSITVLIRSSGERLSLLLTPKSDDVLQLSGFAAIAYGEEGEYDTHHGRAVVQDLGSLCCMDHSPPGPAPTEAERGRRPSGSSPRHSVGSPAHRHRVIATSARGSVEPDPESPGKLPPPPQPFAAGRDEDLQRPSSSSTSHDEIYILAKLEEIPISPQPPIPRGRGAGQPWVGGRDVNHLLMENRSLSDLPGNHSRQLSGDLHGNHSRQHSGDLHGNHSRQHSGDLHGNHQRQPSEVSTVDSELLMLGGGPVHIRQSSALSSDSSDLHYMPRKLSMEGRLFTEHELGQLGSSTTLPSASTLPSIASRTWSEGPLSPTHSHPDAPTGGGEEGPRRRASIRKQSLEDLTRLDVDEPRALSPPSSQRTSTTLVGGASQGDLTPRNHQSLSQDSAGSDDQNKKRWSTHRRSHHHRPSLVMAMAEHPLLELNPARSGRGAGRKEKRPLRMSGEVILESEEGPSPRGMPSRSFSMDAGDIKRGVRSHSLEQLDEIGDGGGDELNSASYTQPQLQSQPEYVSMRTRPRSAGGNGRLSLRYADHFGILNRKIEKDDTGRRYKTKQCFVVVKGTKLHFYKDQEDAEAGGPGISTPVDLVGAQSGIPEYQKKPHVYRLVTSSGTGMLFQADSDLSVRKWLEMIQLKSGVDSQLPGYLTVDSSLDKSGSRRGSHGKGEDSGSSKFLGKIKKRFQGAESTVTFGVILDNCPKSASDPHLPRVIELCTSEIEKRGLECQGLFRMQANEAVISLLITEINKGNFDCSSITEEWEDVIVVTTLMKRFIKQLPESLIPASLYQEFITAARSPSPEGMVVRVKELLCKLPPVHYNTLHHIVRHFSRVVGHADQNLMTASNLAIVFSPTFLTGPNNESIFKDMKPRYQLIESLITNTAKLFDQELPLLQAPMKNKQRSMSDESGRLVLLPANSKIPAMKRATVSSSAMDPAHQDPPGQMVPGKVYKAQRIQEWIRDSDFQGSQEDADETSSQGEGERRVSGSLWAGGPAKPHSKRRLSHPYRSLNPSETTPPPNAELTSSQPTPLVNKDAMARKSQTLDERQLTKLKRKQSYITAQGTGSLGPSYGSRIAAIRERSVSLSEQDHGNKTDNQVVKDFLGSGREPSDRVVYNFINPVSPIVEPTNSGSNSQETADRKPPRSTTATNNSPFTTYQESFL